MAKSIMETPDSSFEELVASLVISPVKTVLSYDNAVIATDAVVRSKVRTFRTDGQKMVTDPAGLFEAFAAEVFASRTLIDSEDERLQGIGIVGDAFADILHQRLQNNGLVAGEVKANLDDSYRWRPILASQTGVIQSILIEFSDAAKARPDAPDFRRAVSHWQRRYESIFTANKGSSAALTGLANLFKKRA